VTFPWDDRRIASAIFGVKRPLSLSVLTPDRFVVFGIHNSRRDAEVQNG
jgi:hypothetical protein